MPTIEASLTEIQSRLDGGEAAWPEQALTALIEQMGPAELSDWRADLEMLVHRFHKKRRKHLERIFRERIGANGKAPPGILDPAASYTAIGPESPLWREFEHTLDELRERHIFQWSTFYRDGLAKHFEKFLTALRSAAPDDLADALTGPLAHHARQAFSAGYLHARDKGLSHDLAVGRAANGLARFLALPLEFYAARASAAADPRSACALRLLLSAAVTGILTGWSSTSFGKVTGGELLPRFRRSWMHCSAFLLPRHAERIIAGIETGDLSEGLKTSLLPALEALQKLFDNPGDDYSPLPVTGQYSWHRRRLDIAVRPPGDAQRLMEVSVFLEEGFVSITELEDAIARQATLVIAPMRPDVQKIVNDRAALSDIVVPVEPDRSRTAKNAHRVWNEAIDKLRSRLQRNAPITYNFAEEFPLEKPDKAPFFHVSRTSVRDLLRTFERRNGVRLWCSVRRSGKTTACLDLGSTSGDSTVVSQTCGQSDREEAQRFHKNVRQALAAGQMLSETFVKDAVADCAPVDVENRRVVFVLDEYETLFDHLDAAAEGSRLTRYNVVQPILNQLASFSHENLLVFLGQKPGAHFILMDQNQLAPYVTQEPFPLFEHSSGKTKGEFPELVDKILGGRVECTADFLDALFAETAGHPFLTANVLVEFVDWLIDTKRPQSALRVDASDFEHFAAGRLQVDRILSGRAYRFFRRAAAEAMSERGFRNNPWLFAAYWLIRGLSGDGADRFAAPLARLDELTRKIPVPAGERLPDPEELLSSASLANFLERGRDAIAVKIRTLGRIAAAVRPALA